MFSMCVSTAINYEASKEMAHCAFLVELKRAVQILLTEYVTTQAAYHSIASGHIFIYLFIFFKYGGEASLHDS